MPSLSASRIPDQRRGVAAREKSADKLRSDIQREWLARRVEMAGQPRAVSRWSGQTSRFPPEKDLSSVRSFLFGVVDGAGKDDRSAWQRFWSKVKRLEPGEVFDFEIVFPRNSKFHRKFFALLQVGFESWDPGRKHKTHKGIPVTKNFEQFREDVTILAPASMSKHSIYQGK